MLLGLRELLYSLDDLLVVLALHSDGNGEAAHDEGSIDIVILGDCLEVRYLQSTGGLVENLGEVLCHEPVHSLQGAEPKNPVVRGLR